MNVGCLLLDLDVFRDDHFAVRLFELCATWPKLTFHESSVLYGAALVLGTGGIERNLAKGMKYHNLACYGA